MSNVLTLKHDRQAAKQQAREETKERDYSERMTRALKSIGVPIARRDIPHSQQITYLEEYIVRLQTARAELVKKYGALLPPGALRAFDYEISKAFEQLAEIQIANQR